jgi:signal transduction histidine kinase
VLLAKTLRSSTFKSALIFIVVFGAMVFALFGYVYSSTASYVLGRFDRAIETDRVMLIAAYENGRRDELVAEINKFIADKRRDDSIILLADPAFTAIAGNLRSWPPSLVGDSGLSSFEQNGPKPEAAHRPLLRAAFETLPDGSHLLVGKDIDDLDQVAKRIYLALAFVLSLIFIIALVAAIAVTRRTVGRIEAINGTSRAIMQSGLGKRVPVCGSRDEWDQLAESLNSMFDRIEVLMGEVKQATDNVAHDLRTPLTRMRGRLERPAPSNAIPRPTNR